MGAQAAPSLPPAPMTAVLRCSNGVGAWRLFTVLLVAIPELARGAYFYVDAGIDRCFNRDIALHQVLKMTYSMHEKKEKCAITLYTGSTVGSGTAYTLVGVGDYAFGGATYPNDRINSI